MSDAYKSVGPHEASARLLLARHAIDGVQVPASLGLTLIDAGRRIDDLPADDSARTDAEMNFGQLLVSIVEQIADLFAPTLCRRNGDWWGSSDDG
jgi:hypothetical protein